MKKICVLKSSPRKRGNTTQLLEEFLSHFSKEEYEVTEFDLYSMDINPCIACNYCQKNWDVVECSQKDDMTEVFQAVDVCDLIVLASPIYSFFCTPPLKSALDRMVFAFNMFYSGKKGPAIWAGKKLAVVTTCGMRPEDAADVFEAGIVKYCKHSQLEYVGMLAERHYKHPKDFMDPDKAVHAKEFALKVKKEF